MQPMLPLLTANKRYTLVNHLLHAVDILATIMTNVVKYVSKQLDN